MGRGITAQDVFQTLIEAAGFPVALGTDMDGASRWDVIDRSADTPPPDFFGGEEDREPWADVVCD